MIRFYVPGLLESDFGSKEDQRQGDCTIIEGTETLIIDGYCGKAATRLITRLKKRKIRRPYLLLTHPHYDHYDGIRKIINDPYFSPKALYCQKKDFYKAYNSTISANIRILNTIVSEAEHRGIPVIFLSDGDDVTIGDIHFKAYMEKPEFTGNSDAYLNKGSICCWFPDLLYLTTGDAGVEVAKKHDLHPLFCKGGHHGNDFVRAMAKWLKEHGCLYYWDNDYSLELTPFLMTGREDAQAVGMTVFGVHGDINFVYYGGKCVIYKGGKTYEYKCPYKGKTALKLATPQVVYNTCKGKYGSSETRVTNLLDAGFYPSNTQTWVNRFYEFFKR